MTVCFFSIALDKIRRKEAIKKISKERAKVRHAKRSAESDLFDQRTIRIETSTSTLTEVVASDVENEMTEGSRVNKPTNADGKKNMEAASRVTQTKAANVELNWTDGFVVKIPAVTSGMLKMGPLAPCARNALVRDIMDQVMEVRTAMHLLSTLKCVPLTISSSVISKKRGCRHILYVWFLPFTRTFHYPLKH